MYNRKFNYNTIQPKWLCFLLNAEFFLLHISIIKWKGKKTFRQKSVRDLSRAQQNSKNKSVLKCRETSMYTSRYTRYTIIKTFGICPIFCWYNHCWIPFVLLKWYMCIQQHRLAWQREREKPFFNSTQNIL